MKDYNKENIPLAKTLRKNMTPWERKLWYDFLRYYPVRFQRQKAIGNYIADFYCAKARLVIELDGGGHYTAELARVYLKTPNAPGQRTFSRCAAPFFLEIRQYSCEKMSCSAQKFPAAGHIGSFQIHPRKDEMRTKDLESMNLTVVRICNLDIDRNFSGVCEYIDLTVKRLSLSQLR